MFKFKIQFQKVDKYKNNIFICRPKDEVYQTLKMINSKLKATYPSAMSSIYINDEYEYITLRTSNSDKYTFKAKNTYEITIRFKHKQTEKGDYINAIITNSACIKRYSNNQGEDIKIEL